MAARNSTLLFSPGFQQVLDGCLDREIERVSRVLAESQPRKQKPAKVKLVCNECGRKRSVSPNADYNERCPNCGGVDWDVVEEVSRGR